MLKGYVQSNKKLGLRVDKDINKDKFLFLSKELNDLKARLEGNKTQKLGDIVSIRLGGFTGCDNAFLINQEKAEYLLGLGKYDNLIIPCKRPKGFQSNSDVKEYLIHIHEGFTSNELGVKGITLEEFKTYYKEIFEHFDGLDEGVYNSLLNRQEHFKGDYWWELSKGQCNYDNYKKEGYLVPRISKKFELIDFDGSFIPLNGFSYIQGKLSKDIEEYLRSDDFTTLFNNFYSTDVKQGGYYTRNVNVVKTIKV